MEKVMNHVVDRRVRRTKMQLKKSFIDLMAFKPFASITVKDIVEFADYNRTTFYRHYHDKDQLVEEVMNDLMNGLAKAVKDSDQNIQCSTSAHYIHEDIVLFDFILRNKNFFQLWKDSEAIPGFHEYFIHTLMKHIKERLELRLSQEKNINDDLYVTYCSYGIAGLIIEWIKNDFPHTPRYMSEQTFRIVNYQPYKKYFYDK